MTQATIQCKTDLKEIIDDYPFDFSKYEYEYPTIVCRGINVLGILDIILDYVPNTEKWFRMRKGNKVPKVKKSKRSNRLNFLTLNRKEYSQLIEGLNTLHGIVTSQHLIIPVSQDENNVKIVQRSTKDEMINQLYLELKDVKAKILKIENQIIRLTLNAQGEDGLDLSQCCKCKENCIPNATRWKRD